MSTPDHHDPICAALTHDDEDSCSCGLYARDAAIVAAVLAEHALTTDDYSPLCACGQWRDKRDFDRSGHRAHVASAILAADPIAQALAAAWEDGRRHGERNFISCPDDNPYSAALNPGGRP